jgi:hypothetical protein
MPLSSAREISGQSMTAAIVTAQPTRRMFDLIDVVANLRSRLRRHAQSLHAQTAE